jgi:hypothetical protein
MLSAECCVADQDRIQNVPNAARNEKQKNQEGATLENKCERNSQFANRE